METQSYWNRFGEERRTRRRMLKLGALIAGGGAAIAMVGCGGGDDEETTPSVVSDIKDRSNEAKHGGVLNHTQVTTNTLDAIGSANSFARLATAMVYTRLMKTLPGVNEPAAGEKVGDTAQSWELSPDGLKLTFKIRPGLGSDPRPPLNGRNLDASDVMFSWNRWAQVSSLRGDLVNSLNPDGPVLAVSSPDKDTVVFDLKFPSALLMDYLTDGFYLWIMPKESDGGFNPNNEAHGAGPYYMTDFLEGARYSMRRNPNYYEKPLPYIDEQNWYIIPEAAAQLAQFEAKHLDLPSGLYTVGGGLRQEDVAGMRERHPELLLYQVPISDVAATLKLGYMSPSPFEDVRVRQAFSMVHDRDALAEFFTSKSELEASGLPVEARWASHISAMYPEYGHPGDPASFGENAKYFAYNVEEARKLLEAAGRVGLEISYHVNGADTTYVQNGELLAGHASDSGLFKARIQVQDLTSYVTPKISRGRGNFEGVGYTGVAFKYSPESFIFANFHPSAGTTHVKDDLLFPGLVDMASKVARELDETRRRAIVKQFVNDAAKEMPTLPVGSSSERYAFTWPWLAQAGVLKQWPGDTMGARNVLYSRFWIDQELASRYGKA